MSQAGTRSFLVPETSRQRLPRGAPSLGSTPIAAGRQVNNSAVRAIDSRAQLHDLWAAEAVCVTFEPDNLRSSFPTCFGDVRVAQPAGFGVRGKSIAMHLDAYDIETMRRRYTPNG